MLAERTTMQFERVRGDEYKIRSQDEEWSLDGHQAALVAEAVPRRLQTVHITLVLVVQIFLQLPGVRHLD